MLFAVLEGGKLYLNKLPWFLDGVAAVINQP